MLKVFSFVGLAWLLAYSGLDGPLQNVVHDPAPASALLVILAGGLFTIALAVKIRD